MWSECKQKNKWEQMEYNNNIPKTSSHCLPQCFSSSNFETIPGNIPERKDKFVYGPAFSQNPLLLCTLIGSTVSGCSFIHVLLCFLWSNILFHSVFIYIFTIPGSISEVVIKTTRTCVFGDCYVFRKLHEQCHLFRKRPIMSFLGFCLCFKKFWTSVHQSGLSQAN